MDQDFVAQALSPKNGMLNNFAQISFFSYPFQQNSLTVKSNVLQLHID